MGYSRGVNVIRQVPLLSNDGQEVIPVSTIINRRTAVIRMTGRAVSKRNTIMKSRESLGEVAFDLTRLSIRSEVISCSDQ